MTKRIRFRFILITAVILMLALITVYESWYTFYRDFAMKNSADNMQQTLASSTAVFDNEVMDILHIISYISVRTGYYQSNLINYPKSRVISTQNIKRQGHRVYPETAGRVL